MELKQRLHDGDRSHPRVVALDETKAYLSYPGWRSDAAKAEMAWMCWSLPDHLESTVAKMKRKQEYHEACPPNVLTAVCASLVLPKSATACTCRASALVMAGRSPFWFCLWLFLWLRL